MDSPARASAGAKGTNAGPVASRSRTVPIVARGNVDDDDDGDDDDDDEDDEDYVLGNLDASDLEDDSDEDEDEDAWDDVSVAPSQPEREDIEDSDSDSLSLEDEDFAAIVGAAAAETPRKRRVRGYGCLLYTSPSPRD